MTARVLTPSEPYFGLILRWNRVLFQYHLVLYKTKVALFLFSVMLKNKEIFYDYQRIDMKTIALISESGAGKGLFITLLKKILPGRKIAVVRFSAILSDILDILGKEKSRDNIDTLVTALRKAFKDQGILNAGTRKLILGTDADILVLDGLRKISEIPVVREQHGILVYLVADERVRFERRRQESEKPDEKGMSWQQFRRQAKAAPQRQIREIGETMADVMIENNESIEELEKKIKEFAEKNGL